MDLRVQEEVEMISQTGKQMNLHRVITNVWHALPKGVLSIEDIIIKGNQVIVRYKTQHDQNVQNMSLINDSQAVTVDSFKALRLNDGKVMEQWDNIYQIKTS